MTRLSEPHRTHLLDAAGTSRSEIRAQDVGLSPLGRAARFLSLHVWETSWQLRSQAGVGRVAAASQGYKYSATPSPKLSDGPVSMSDADCGRFDHRIFIVCRVLRRAGRAGVDPKAPDSCWSICRTLPKRRGLGARLFMSCA